GHAGDSKKCRINQRLLDAVAQILRLHQVLDQTVQNIGQGATGFTGRNEIHIDRWKNPGEIPKCLREAASVHQSLVKGVRHLLHLRLPQALLENGQSLVERHSRPQQVAELLGENQQLAVWDL